MSTTLPGATAVIKPRVDEGIDLGVKVKIVVSEKMTSGTDPSAFQPIE
jgi:hypothetical protein